MPVMKKKLPNEDKSSKPGSKNTDGARIDIAPSENQIRLMALHLWLMDVARDPDGKDTILIIESSAKPLGFDPLHYHEEATSVYLALRAQK